MRNRDLFETKFERLEATIKLAGYHIHRDEKQLAYDHIDKSLEMIQDLTTLLRTETQD
jgi:hypothetical protein